MSFKIILALMVYTLSIFAHAVGNDDDSSTHSDSESSYSEEAWEEEVLNIIDEAGTVLPEKRASTQTNTGHELSSDGTTRYINVKHDETLAKTEITHVGLNDQVIFPGALVKGDKINDFVYYPITLPRRPINISVSAEGAISTKGKITHSICNPQKLSDARDGISTLLKTAIGPETTLPARIEFKTKEVFSDEQLTAAVGLDVKYGLGNIETDFNWDKSKKLNHIVATYKQVYFTVDVDTPPRPCDIFDPKADIALIKEVMSPGSLPVYVSSVKYGVIAVMLMESEHSASSMQTALKAAYNGAVSLNLDAGFSSTEILDRSKLKVVVYGGSAKGLEKTMTGVESFLKVIQASKEYSPSSPAVPIAYSFRNVKDNLLAAVNRTTSYSISTPVSIKQKVKTTITSCRCIKSDDEGPNNDADMSRLFIGVQCIDVKADGSSKKVGKQETIYDFRTSGERTVSAGEVWNDALNRNASVIFNTEDYDFENSSTLVIRGYGREEDDTGNDEHGYGSIVLKGEDGMFGTHSFTINSADFAFLVTVNVEPVTGG